MFTLTSFTSPARSSTILSSTGATAWHGPHHSAQKSTITGLSLSSTSWVNVSSLTAVAIQTVLSLGKSRVPPPRGMKPTGPDDVFPRIRARVQAASGQARPPRARARDPRPLGARGHLRAPPRAEPRRPEVQLRRRSGDGEQDGARRPYRLGADAEGRLPALQGATGARAALPERVRLPGALDRGRRRALARPQLEAGDRGVRARRVRPPLPRSRGAVVPGTDRGVDPARAVDELGRRLLHL